MRPTGKRIASILRQHGYKLTPQREAVLQVIANSPGHLTPAEIYAQVHQTHPGVGLVTVYRTLNTLVKLGLVCEVHAGGKTPRYVGSTLKHHGHLICSKCGKVVDFTECSLDELEQRLARETGFKIEGHLLQFFGSCQDCQWEESG